MHLLLVVLSSAQMAHLMHERSSILRLAIWERSPLDRAGLLRPFAPITRPVVMVAPILPQPEGFTLSTEANSCTSAVTCLSSSRVSRCRPYLAA